MPSKLVRAAKRLSTATKLPSVRRGAAGDTFPIEEVSFETSASASQDDGHRCAASVASSDSEGSCNKYGIVATKTFSEASADGLPFFAPTGTLSQSMGTELFQQKKLEVARAARARDKAEASAARARDDFYAAREDVRRALGALREARDAEAEAKLAPDQFRGFKIGFEPSNEGALERKGLKRELGEAIRKARRAAEAFEVKREKAEAAVALLQCVEAEMEEFEIKRKKIEVERKKAEVEMARREQVEAEREAARAEAEFAAAREEVVRASAELRACCAGA